MNGSLIGQVTRRFLSTYKSYYKKSINKYNTNIRWFSKSSKRFQDIQGDSHKPSDWDKKLLVWGGMFKTTENIPEFVTGNQLRKSRDLFRIRVNIMMLFATLFGCMFMIYLGKKHSREGQSLHKQGLEWQQKMQDEGKREREATADKNK